MKISIQDIKERLVKSKINNFRHHYPKRKRIKRIVRDICIDEASNWAIVDSEHDKQLPIYMVWWQGIDNMPPIVRACYENVLAKSGSHPVNLITRNNFNKFLPPPANLSNLGCVYWNDNIGQSLLLNNLSVTQFTDFVRTYLLYRTGGIWIDCTVYVTAKSMDDFIKLPYMSGRRNEKNVGYCNPAYGRWTSYFICTRRCNPLMRYIYECLCQLLKNDGTIREYFSIDYLFTMAYDQSKVIRNLVNASPIFEHKFFELEHMLNQNYNEHEFDRICRQLPFYKLTYKNDFSEFSNDGKLTNYGYILRQSRHNSAV